MQLIPLGNSSINESAVFFEPDTLDGQVVMPWGKFISSSDVILPRSAQNLVVVQHGLPGDQWRLDMEEKAREFVSGRVRSGVLCLIPRGIGIDSEYKLGINSTDKTKCINAEPGFFTIPFSLDQYVRAMCAAVCDLRRTGAPDQQIHAVGHSYGALALLYAIRQWIKLGVRLPESLSFLSPFVKAVINTGDPDIALNIISTRLKVDHQAKLAELLGGLSRFYKMESGGGTLSSHEAVFNEDFFGDIGILGPELQNQCSVQTVRGGEDPFIEVGHSDLIARIVGQGRECMERVLPHDDHALSSLRMDELVGM